MVSTKILRQDSVSVAHAIETAAAGQGYLTAPISVKDGDNLGAFTLRLFYKLTLDAVVPALGTTVDIYALYGDGDGVYDAGSTGIAVLLTGASTPTVSQVALNAERIRSIELSAVANQVLSGSVVVPIDGAANVAFAFVFHTNAGPHATHGNHLVKYVAIYPASV